MINKKNIELGSFNTMPSYSRISQESVSIVQQLLKTKNEPLSNEILTTPLLFNPRDASPPFIAHCIFEKVFLGGESADTTPNQVQLEVDYLLSVSIYFSNPRILKRQPQRYFLGHGNEKPIEDISLRDFSLYNLKEAFKFVDEARSKDRSILIHCQQGQDRSATFLICYLIYSCGVDRDKAYNFIKSKRFVNVNPISLSWINKNQEGLKSLKQIL